MYLFYASMILIGVVCVAVSLFVYILDKKKMVEMIGRIDSKTEALVDTIHDAEQIILEMNQFSDYLLERIDEKVKELENHKDLKFRLAPSGAHSMTENLGDLSAETVAHLEKPRIDLKTKGSDLDFSEIFSSASQKPVEHPEAVPSKYQDVYALKEEGLPEIEIAKELDMGIGAVRLILGMKS
jgi:DNA-binding NarL/FixJ family response regulator